MCMAMAQQGRYEAQSAERTASRDDPGGRLRGARVWRNYAVITPPPFQSRDGGIDLFSVRKTRDHMHAVRVLHRLDFSERARTSSSLRC